MLRAERDRRNHGRTYSVRYLADIAENGYIDLGIVRCLLRGSLQPDTSDQPDGAIPEPGRAYFYLVRFNNELAAVHCITNRLTRCGVAASTVRVDAGQAHLPNSGDTGGVAYLRIMQTQPRLVAAIEKFQIIVSVADSDDRRGQSDFVAGLVNANRSGKHEEFLDAPADAGSWAECMPKMIGAVRNTVLVMLR